MKSNFELTGWIESANVIEPEKKWYEDKAKYKLSILPYDSHKLCELEMQAEQYKEYAELHREYLSSDEYSQYEGVNKDRVLDGDTVLLETIIEPHIYNNLNLANFDDELIGKFVKVKGNIQVIEPDFNVFLSFHILDEAIHPKVLEKWNRELQEVADDCDDFDF